MPADLHTHSEASSDSSIPILDRIELASERGIDTVGITDHMAVHGWLDGRTQHHDGVTVVSGVEANCTVADGRVDILGLFVDPDTLRARVGATTREGVTVEDGADLDPGTIIEWIHGAGGVAVVAHPGRYDRALGKLMNTLVEAGIDGIETYYPYEKSPPGTPNTPRVEIERIADTHELVRSGGNDCHGPEYVTGTLIGIIELPDCHVDELQQQSQTYR